MVKVLNSFFFYVFIGYLYFSFWGLSAYSISPFIDSGLLFWYLVLKKLILFLHVCVYMRVHGTCGGQRTIFRSLFSPSTMWVQQSELRLSVLVASIFASVLAFSLFSSLYNLDANPSQIPTSL